MRILFVITCTVLGAYVGCHALLDLYHLAGWLGSHVIVIQK